MDPDERSVKAEMEMPRTQAGNTQSSSLKFKAMVKSNVSRGEKKV